MTIWVDSDSCPVRVREIISRASVRLFVNTVFVANRKIPIYRHELISFIMTDATEQSADSYIINSVKKGDLVVTRDIPLAAELVAVDVIVINDRGNVFTKDNVKERLSMRNFMYEMRCNGLMTDKMRQFNKTDLQKFSNTFDKILTKMLKNV